MARLGARRSQGRAQRVRPDASMDAAQRRALKALYREYSNAGSGVMAPSLGVEVSPVNVHDEGEIERAVTTFGRSENNGLIVTASALVRVHCARLPGRFLFLAQPTLPPGTKRFCRFA